jgi:DNA helicase-2/ATP-dependent DNA helicase PcrA
MEDALRKRDIPYRIYGGLSFYQRKEIKDVLCYLRLIINPKDEEALVRVINYPARGIGDSTIEKLTIAANHYKRSMFEIMLHIDQIDLKLNSGTKAKLKDFVQMIQSFQVIDQNHDAFFLADHVAKKTGLIQELRKDATPEGVARIENIEELLNGIKDFTIGQEEVDGARGSLSEFLEDVALATDLDKDTSDEDRVALMTIHLAKGLEFPTVFIVGLEEDLFPSAMSLNTRSELEEERRLFYVALTRAEHQAYLSYAQSRYRWGKLSDCEPSRFIEEIDDQYLEYISPVETNYRYKPMIDTDIFGDVDKSKLRQSKPVAGIPPKQYGETPSTTIRKLKPVDSSASFANKNATDTKLSVGQYVMHERFGKGEIINIEGVGADKKAEIRFEVGGIKKLLLRFAKLEVIA